MEALKGDVEALQCKLTIKAAERDAAFREKEACGQVHASPQKEPNTAWLVLATCVDVQILGI
jgi:hypothetical protein